MVGSGRAHAIRTDKGSAMADATEQPQPVSDHPQVPDAPESLAEAVVRTVHHPLLVLTGELVIERANPAFYRCFQVTSEETIGCRLYDLGNGQWDIPQLRRLLDEVLPETQTVEDYRVEHDFAQMGPRIMILNARHMACGGGPDDRILLALADLTQPERARYEPDGARA